jgi:hypothetical protein
MVDRHIGLHALPRQVDVLPSRDRSNDRRTLRDNWTAWWVPRRVNLRDVEPTASIAGFHRDRSARSHARTTLAHDSTEQATEHAPRHWSVNVDIPMYIRPRARYPQDVNWRRTRRAEEALLCVYTLISWFALIRVSDGLCGEAGAWTDALYMASIIR